MRTFRIEKQTLDIDGKIIKFEYPVSIVIFFNNIFFILFEPNSDNKQSGQFQNLWGINTEAIVLPDYQQCSACFWGLLKLVLGHA